MFLRKLVQKVIRGGKRSRGGSSSKHKDFEEFEQIDQNINRIYLSDLSKIEDKLEALNRASKIPSIMFPISQKIEDEKHLILLAKNLQRIKNKLHHLDQNILGVKLLDKHLNSNYKEYLINKKYHIIMHKQHVFRIKAPNINIFSNLQIGFKKIKINMST